jgi:hypothetical protein
MGQPGNLCRCDAAPRRAIGWPAGCAAAVAAAAATCTSARPPHRRATAMLARDAAGRESAHAQHQQAPQQPCMRQRRRSTTSTPAPARPDQQRACQPGRACLHHAACRQHAAQCLRTTHSSAKVIVQATAGRSMCRTAPSGMPGAGCLAPGTTTRLSTRVLQWSAWHRRARSPARTSGRRRQLGTQQQPAWQHAG